MSNNRDYENRIDAPINIAIMESVWESHGHCYYFQSNVLETQAL